MNNMHQKYHVWIECLHKGTDLIKEGLAFYAQNGPLQHSEIALSKEEFASNARFLHRGYYCPSPIQDKLVGNAKRGKLVRRKTEKTKITHRYLFDSSNRLIIVEAFLPDGNKKTEYLVYKGNVVNGYAFDNWGTLVGVSEESYCNNIIQSYFCASCFNHELDRIDWGITNIHYETYSYNDTGLEEADFYLSNFLNSGVKSPEEADTLIQGGRYKFVCKDNEIISFYST